MKKFSVLIIGAGKIGAFYDKPGNPMVLSHAHAFSEHEGFNLTGFIDSNHTKAEQAAEVWGGSAFASIETAFSTYDVDLVVVATPDENHYQTLIDVAAYPVQLVFAEKPLAKTFREAQEITRLYQDRGIALTVNYTRRFVPELLELKTQIDRGEFGKFLHGAGYYGKGFLHNGSHMIDLVRFLLGEIEDIRELNTICDYSHADPSFSVQLEIINRGYFSMLAIDSRNYSIFELQLFFEKGRINMTDLAYTLEKSRIAENRDFPGYFILKPSTPVRADIGKAMLHAADNMYNFLNGTDSLACTARDGLEAVRLCTCFAEGTKP